MHVRTGDRLYSLIRMTSVESTYNLIPEKSQGGHKMVTHPCGDHSRLCLTWLFRVSALALRNQLSNEDQHHIVFDSGCLQCIDFQHIDFHTSYSSM